MPAFDPPDSDGRDPLRDPTRGRAMSPRDDPPTRPVADDADTDQSPAGGEHPAASPYKSIGGAVRLWHALRYSLRGLTFAFRFESAFRQEALLAVVLVPLAFLLRLPALETLALIASVAGVLIVELLNSSIEAAVDRISLAHHPLAGRAKDLGSAAVFVALLLCLATWVVVAGPVVTERLATHR